MLLDAGVDPYAKAEDTFNRTSTQTALEVAAYFGKGENASAILSHPKFQAGDRELRQALLDKCLTIGAASRSPGLIEVLLDQGANPKASRNGVTAMQIATRRIHPNSEEENAEIKQIVALLLEHGATLDLFSAVAIGDEAQVRQLLKQDPKSANARGPDGYPALHFAVGMNDKPIVEALLGAGGDVDIRNEAEYTGTAGETALHCAAFWGHFEVAKLLIDRGADVNALTQEKGTPLHDAARMCNAKVARLLLDSGANRDARDKDGQTPLDWSRELNRADSTEIEKLFREFSLQKDNKQRQP
jgi:ankyrin repeat protein